MSEILDKKVFKKILNQDKYLDKYGGSLFISIVTVFIILLLVWYNNILKNGETLEKNWEEERCNPSVMPFVGILKQFPNKSKVETTLINFSDCTMKFVSDGMQKLFGPFRIAMATIGTSLSLLSGGTIVLQQGLYFIRKKLLELLEKIISIFYFILIPIGTVVRVMHDLISRSQVLLTIGVYMITIAKRTFQIIMNHVLDIFTPLLASLLAISIGFLKKALVLKKAAIAKAVLAGILIPNPFTTPFGIATAAIGIKIKIAFLVCLSIGIITMVAFLLLLNKFLYYKKRIRWLLDDTYWKQGIRSGEKGSKFEDY